MTQSEVFGGEGLPVSLTCQIHSNPGSMVSWLKNTIEINAKNSRYRFMGGFSAGNSGSKHTLVISNLGIEDFANYSCLAINSMGKEEKYIELKGKIGTLPYKQFFSCQTAFY